MPEEGFFGLAAPGPARRSMVREPDLAPPTRRGTSRRPGGTPTPASPTVMWPPCAGSASSTPPAPTSSGSSWAGSHLAPHASRASLGDDPPRRCDPLGGPRPGRTRPPPGPPVGRPPPRRCGWSAWTYGPGPSSSPSSPTSTPSAWSASPGAQHPRRRSLAIRAGAAPGGRQEPRPRRRRPAPRRPRSRRRCWPVWRGRRPAPPASGGRG